MNTSGISPLTIWRRVHRPEEYAEEVAKFVAREMKVPFVLVRPLVPVARAIISKWEDAGIETTSLYSLPDGGRVLRTFFQITDYSNDAIYGALEKVLWRLGVGADFSKRYGDTDFTWILLGGVLSSYAGCAGLCRKSEQSLLDFRFPLSDYFTAITWYPDTVEIANLKTGRVETLALNPREIKKVVDWTLDYEKNLTGKKCIKIEAGSELFKEYLRLDAIYEGIKKTGVPWN